MILACSKFAIILHGLVKLRKFPMRLSEALQINRQPVSPTAVKRRINLVCGFTPLHLETILRAHARLRFPGDDIQVGSGLFGDFDGNLVKASAQPVDGAVVVLEWADIDARLGMRASAGWSEQVLTDMLRQVPERLRRYASLLAEAAASSPTVVAGPTLPLPPLTHFPVAQMNSFDLQLRCTMMSFLKQVHDIPGLTVLSDSAIDMRSPHAGRYDAKLDLHAGFPYTLPHAVAMSSLAVECLFPMAAKKGLITDLDDTLWKGILGDDGVDGVAWNLETHSQPHALYQQTVASMADSGVLVAVASKNDPDLVDKTFERPDILLKKSQVFPLEASWGAKSEAVGRILRAWNIAADSVVFVDDSPLELAEVGEKYPSIECLRFPREDPAGVVDLLYQLRCRFGKTSVRAEDRLRLQSLRSAAGVTDAAESGESTPDFLSRLDATLTLEFSASATDGRSFELVNKTNQFNLNGRRYTESEWRSYFRQPGSFLLSVAYQDRFGPLGKIAVLGGRALPSSVQVDIWVMSCRAFSRHIEFQTLRRLFQKYCVAELGFCFEQTPRNGPLADFFRRFFPAGLEGSSPGGLRLAATQFEAACPELFHQVSEINHG